MSIRLYPTDLIDRNILRQKTIQLLSYFIHIQRFTFVVEVGNHQRRMYPGIGPSRPNHFRIFPQEGGKCLHQTFLYTDSVRLNLPSMIMGAIIG